MTKNKQLFNMLIGANNTVNIPITSHEKFPLITAIEREIKHRLDNKISVETGEDIISLRNTLQNLRHITKF